MLGAVLIVCCMVTNFVQRADGNLILLDEMSLGQEMKGSAQQVQATEPGSGIWVEQGLIVRIRGASLRINGVSLSAKASVDQVSIQLKGYMHQKRRTDFVIWYPLSQRWWLIRLGPGDYETGYWPPPKGIRDTLDGRS